MSRFKYPTDSSSDSNFAKIHTIFNKDGKKSVEKWSDAACPYSIIQVSSIMLDFILIPKDARSISSPIYWSYVIIECLGSGLHKVW